MIFMAHPIAKLVGDAMNRIERFDAEVLLAHCLQKPREFLLTHPDFFVPWPEEFKFQNLVKKRSRGIPVAYLTGHKEFFGFDFLVNKHTLIPRPDTELLVEEAIKEIDTGEKKIFIDVGTGSGCIPIAILKSFKKTHPKTFLETYAVDISKKALAVAKQNARKHFVDITFLCGDLLQPFFKETIFLQTNHLILTANLPYLTQKQFNEEPSIQHEPVSALVAEDQGLAFYKKLLEQIRLLQENHAFEQATLFFEIDPSQSSLLSSHILSKFSTARVQVQSDLSGNERLLVTHLS